MKEFRDKSFAGVYKKALTALINDYDYVTAPRGQKIREIRNVCFSIENPELNLFKNKARDIPLKYLAGELIWYFSGSNELKFIDHFSSFWKNIANEDQTLNSAYGNLIFNQPAQNGKSEWFWAYESLVKDKDSRQSIIRFNKPIHSYTGNKDFVCTLNGIFMIRDNKLTFTVYMRSSDIHFGITYDIPAFTLFQQQMHNHLKQHYPDLELGEFNLITHSLHMYDRNYEQCKEMLDYVFWVDKTPKIDYNFIDVDGKPYTDTIKLYNGEAPKQKDNTLGAWLYETAYK